MDPRAMPPSAGRSARLSRLGLTVAAAGICLALAVQWLLVRQLQSAPVFGVDRTAARAVAYGQLSGAVDPMAVKFGHALRHARFRYGLFGSSRALSVSHQHLGLAEHEFFNFSVGGTSLRQNVALLQALQDAGKAPEIAVISLDNHDIQYFRHVEWPAFWAAPGYHLQYLRDELAGGISAGVVLRAAAEAVLVGVKAAVTDFSLERLRSIRLFFHDMPDASFTHAPYRADGSRVLEVGALNEGPPAFSSYTPVWPSMAAGMQADMARLGRLAASGIRIVVFESPIAPQLGDAVMARRDATTVQLRDAISDACRRHGVTCLPAPELPGTTDHPWGACCHAPPALLGRYIAGLL
jgi:hypothetical protein